MTVMGISGTLKQSISIANPALGKASCILTSSKCTPLPVAIHGHFSIVVHEGQSANYGHQIKYMKRAASMLLP